MTPKPKQTYTVWHYDEERYLRLLLWRGVPAETIAEHLGRTASAVRTRMRLLARRDEKK